MIAASTLRWPVRILSSNHRVDQGRALVSLRTAQGCRVCTRDCCGHSRYGLITGRCGDGGPEDFDADYYGDDWLSGWDVDAFPSFDQFSLGNDWSVDAFPSFDQFSVGAEWDFSVNPSFDNLPLGSSWVRRTTARPDPKCSDL